MAHDLLGELGGGYSGDNPFDNFGSEDNTQIEMQKQTSNGSTKETGEVAGNPFDTFFEKEDDPETYMGIYDSLKQNIKNIEINKNEVLRLNSQLMGATTSEAIKKLNSRLDEIMQENHKLCKNVTQQLKSEKQANDQFSKDKKGSSVAQWRANQLNSCAKSFQNNSSEFSDALNEFQETVNEQTKRQIEIVKPQHMTEEDVNKLVEDPEAAQQFVQRSLLMEDISDEMMDTLVGLEDKLQGMEKIVQSLEELRQMWLELNMLITEQQEVIDNIATNVQQTSDYVTQGREKLESAEKHQKCARKLQYQICCCALIILLILIFSILGGTGSMGKS